MAQNNDQPQVFFIDDDLIERLLRGDAAPASAKPKRPAAASGLAAAVAVGDSAMERGPWMAIVGSKLT